MSGRHHGNQGDVRLWIMVLGLTGLWASPGRSVETIAKAASPPGVTAVLGLPDSTGAAAVVELAEHQAQTVYFQSCVAEEVAAVRDAAVGAGLLGRGVFVDQGPWTAISLAENLADTVLVSPSAAEAVPRDELLRILRPGGSAVLPNESFAKPLPEDTDDWRHPYHGPDNNPQSDDRRIVAPYLTQFMAEPLFSPMPVVTVSSGGRIFRAHGHIAHKANQNAWLNTLLCINAYNGTILWRRTLSEGFMIHRNTMVATPDYLYLADDRSCQQIDAATGETVGEFTIPDGLADGPVWKWMALEDGILYALIGGEEPPIRTQRSATRGLGHWPWGMWDGHEYGNPKTSFGFGRTFVAIDVETKQMLWDHSEQDYVDSRGVCMGSGGIYFYSPEISLGCLDAQSGQVRWKTAAKDLLDAIGPNERAQHYVTGYATTTYLKCNDRYLLFAGPQRKRLVVASAVDGSLLWTREGGNLQLVLRDDGFYAAGPQGGGVGWKLGYESGQILATLPQRRACTRATGSLDSIFFRATGGTVRVAVESHQAEHIAPMRPPCHDGVLISNGMLYWGPWMCGCQLSAYGHIGLAPAGEFTFRPGLDASRIEYRADDLQEVTPLDVRRGDWPTYCGDNQRSFCSDVTLPESPQVLWSAALTPDMIPTAPVTAGNLVIAGDRSGQLRAWDASTGQHRWQAYTAGPLFGAPAVECGRVFVGSGDGRVYAFEAATGRPLWRFRAAPADRWIAVYGQLMSTWPVAGGVVVQDGVLYAAAGIHHYDGIHVYALDAVTGEVRWYNDSSGTTSEPLNHGVSLQGELYIGDGELRFLGGGVHEIARYDLKTGACLNESHGSPNSHFPTAYYAYYPEYGKFRSLDHLFADGRRLVYDASYEGAVHGPLTLLPADAKRTPMSESRWGQLIRQRSPHPAGVWTDNSGRRFSAFVVTPNQILGAGEVGDPESPRSFLGAVDVASGDAIWTRGLPATVVPGGIAVNSEGLVFVTLENGQLLTLAASSSPDP
jgi:outer membrane protein assembly factor BamB